jgi:hypothetical protein
MPKELQNATWLRDSCATWSDMVAAAEMSSKVDDFAPGAWYCDFSLWLTESTGSGLTRVLLRSA